MDRFERIINVVLAIAAVVIAVTFAHREFAGRDEPPRTGADIPAPPEFVSNWESFVKSGIQIGDTAAKVKVIEFADFECPFCKSFDSTMHEIRTRYPGSVSLVFIHFPLPVHRFARPAAKASECAADQRKFASFHDVVYAKQDSLGLKSWTSYAREAGVPDTIRFARCVASQGEIARVEAGVALADRLGHYQGTCNPDYGNQCGGPGYAIVIVCS